MKRQRQFIINELQQEWICPITRMPMTDPVILEDGHSYQKQDIQDWLRKKKTSPKTGLLLKRNSVIVPNIILKNVIEKFNHSYKYGVQQIVQQNQEIKDYMNGNRINLDQYKNYLTSIKNQVKGEFYSQCNVQRHKEGRQDRIKIQQQQNSQDDLIENGQKQSVLQQGEMNLGDKELLTSMIQLKDIIEQESGDFMQQLSKYDNSSEIQKKNNILATENIELKNQLQLKENQMKNIIGKLEQMEIKLKYTQQQYEKKFIENILLKTQLDRLKQTNPSNIKVQTNQIKCLEQNNTDNKQQEKPQKVKPKNHPRLQLQIQQLNQQLQIFKIPQHQKIQIQKRQKSNSKNQDLDLLSQESQQTHFQQQQSFKVSKRFKKNSLLKSKNYPIFTRKSLKHQSSPLKQSKKQKNFDRLKIQSILQTDNLNDFCQQKIPIQKYFQKYPVIFDEKLNQLNHSQVPIIFEEFLKYDWQKVKSLNLSHCKITDQQFKTFLSYASNFPNVQYLFLWANRIKNIKDDFVKKFPKIKNIYFSFKKEFSNPFSSQTKIYLQQLRKKYPKIIVQCKEIKM